MRNFTEQLDWDSGFFGKRIARIVINDPDEKCIEEMLSKYKAAEFDLVYVFLPGGVVLTDPLCISYDCEWVDRKVVYGIQIGEESKMPSCIMEHKGDSSLLYPLAFQSGIHSRYRRDTNFSKEEFEQLYMTWIDNSASHLIADKIFVHKSEKGIDGFVTVKIDGKEASIGLIATDIEKQNLGIGSKLVSAVKNFAKEAHVTHLDVATQKDNIQACSFYEKNGFSVKSETNIYHAWLNKQVKPNKHDTF